jgi:hypothetical protein
VRAGTPVPSTVARVFATTCAHTQANTTTTSRYTRRPRNRSDGGSARFRQPAHPQQSE